MDVLCLPQFLPSLAVSFSFFHLWFHFSKAQMTQIWTPDIYDVHWANRACDFIEINANEMKIYSRSIKDI